MKARMEELSILAQAQENKNSVAKSVDLALLVLVKKALVKKAGMVFLLCAAAAITASAQTFTTLFNFGSTDSGGPFVGLVQGLDGNFYGTTEGEIYKITPQAHDSLYLLLATQLRRRERLGRCAGAGH